MSEIRKDAAVAGTESKPLRIIATIISFVFHPVFMPTVLFAILFFLAPSSFAGMREKEFLIWLIRIGYTTMLIPLILVLLLKGLGFLQSIYMHDPKDRIIPLIGTMMMYFWIYHVANSISTANDIQAPFILKVMLLGNFWGIILLFILNIFFKISMHTSAAGGFLGVMIVLLLTNPVNMMLPLFVSLIVCGIIGTARLLLGAHKPGEVWAGYVLGIISQVAAYIYIIW